MNIIHSEKSTLSTIKHTNNHNIGSTNRRFIIQTRTNVIDILFENTVHNNVVTQIFKVIKTQPRKLVNVLFQVSIFLSNSNCTNNQSRHKRRKERSSIQPHFTSEPQTTSTPLWHYHSRCVSLINPS